jgi:glycosyltransferase involved in cell wall biosynthesis
MKLLVLGGAPQHWGGLEEFGVRAAQALERTGRHSVSKLPTATAFLNFSRFPEFVRGLSRLAGYRRAQLDCVWLQYSNLPDLIYLLLAKLLGFPILVTPHIGSKGLSQSNSILRTASCWMLGLADRIALLSKTQEQELQLPAKVPRSYIRTFLPASLGLTGLLPRRDPVAAELQLIHAGRLSEDKGTFLFLDVCEQLRSAETPFCAKIAGGADERTMARLAQTILNYGLENQVKLLGWIAASELPKLLEASDVLVHLSKIDSYPLIVLEGIACAAFPICKDLPGARDMVETYDGHIVSEIAAVQETADFLKGLELGQLRVQSRAAAARLRADYSWDACVRALEAALSATVAHKSKAN